jgi:DNA-binding transcriptional regulator LsrR (DeoR family)
MDAYPVSFNVVPELTSVMSSYAALIELWQRNPECRAHAVNFPSFFASEAERTAFENRPDVRALISQVRDVNMAFYSCGSFGPGSSYGVVREYINRFIDPDFDPAQLYQLGACGEVNWHPYSLDGEIINHPVPYSFGFIDLATLRKLSCRRDRYMVLVAGGPQKVEPIVGALRGGFLNVLVTDKRTLQEVGELDATPA